MRTYLQIIGAVTVTTIALATFDAIMQRPYEIEQNSRGVYGIRDLNGDFYPQGSAENLLRYLQDKDPVELNLAYKKILEEEK